MKCPISVLIPAKNEEKNLARCLAALGDWADEVLLVDSQSTDRTTEIAAQYGAQVLQFHYRGGWPKKRNWALQTYPWRNDWILLLDADELLLASVKTEITKATQQCTFAGFQIPYRIHFLGRRLKHGGSQLYKLSLFRRGRGRYEMRLAEQDNSMGDMEVHEHVVVDGPVGILKAAIQHENCNSLDRFIAKHNEYSNWDAKLFASGGGGELKPTLLGNQAQRRRWLKRSFLQTPGSPAAFFILRYFLQFGFLDGRPGFIYCVFQSIYFFELKAKLFELRQKSVA